MIRDTCAYLKGKGRNVMFDAEHFFTGYAANKEYALASLNAAVEGGASVLCLCETKGGAMLDECASAVKEAYEKFGFLLDAFKYGVPPHAGLAFGLDRLVMLMVGADNIREVIAFPKVKDASDLMCECPNVVDEKQLQELCLKIDIPAKEEEE